MKVAELIPVPTSKITLGNLEMDCLPSSVCSYVLTDDSDEISFIGASKHFDHTIKLHSEKFAKLEGIKGTIDCYFIPCISEEEFLKIEKIWIEQHLALTGKLPSCNVV